MDGCYYKSQVCNFFHFTLCMHLTLVAYCYKIFHTRFSCSYEFMRKNLIFYRSEIHRLTGKVKDKSLMLRDSFDSLNTLQSMSSFPPRSSLTSNLILIKNSYNSVNVHHALHEGHFTESSLVLFLVIGPIGAVWHFRWDALPGEQCAPSSTTLTALSKSSLQSAFCRTFFFFISYKYTLLTFSSLYWIRGSRDFSTYWHMKRVKRLPSLCILNYRTVLNRSWEWASSGVY